MVNPRQTKKTDSYITIRDLTMAYGSFVVMKNLNFTIDRGDIFIIMGGSGCGKSTLMKIMVGLKEPAKGQVLYNDLSFWEADLSDRKNIMKHIGILYQYGALWSSMTLAENVAFPLEEYTDLDHNEIWELVSLKLAMVGYQDLKTFILLKSAEACVNGPHWHVPLHWIRIFCFSMSHQQDWILSVQKGWMTLF